MFGKHLVDQYAGESWDCAECVLRDPAWAFPSGILLHFYYSDGRINLFSIFLSPSQLHIIYCCVARGGGRLVLVINQNRQCMCICGCKNNKKKCSYSSYLLWAFPLWGISWSDKPDMICVSVLWSHTHLWRDSCILCYLRRRRIRPGYQQQNHSWLKLNTL